MKVKFGSTWLAKGEKESVSNLRINGRRVVQPGELLRASYEAPFDRKNKRVSVSFDVAREHDNVQESERFVIDHPCELPEGRQTLLLVAVDDDGRGMERYLPNAVLESDDHHYTGRTTFHSYTIVGGQITSDDPDAEAE